MYTLFQSFLKCVHHWLYWIFSIYLIQIYSLPSPSLLCALKRLTSADCINSTPGQSGWVWPVSITSKRSEGGKRDRNCFYPTRTQPKNDCILQPNATAPVGGLLQIPVNVTGTVSRQRKQYYSEILSGGIWHVVGRCIFMNCFRYKEKRNKRRWDTLPHQEPCYGNNR